MSEPLVIVGNGMTAARLVDELTRYALARHAIGVIGDEQRLASNWPDESACSQETSNALPSWLCAPPKSAARCTSPEALPLFIRERPDRAPAILGGALHRFIAWIDLPHWVVCHERRVSCLRRANCTRDEGGPFEFGDQEPISSHRKLLRAKAVVVSVAETHGRERRPQHLLVFQVNIIPDTEEGRQQKSLRRVVAKK